MTVQPLKYRKAREKDLDFLVSLRQATMQPHFEQSGIAYHANEQLQRVLYEFECTEIVALDGVDMGLLKVNKATDPWHLIQIQLLPAFQGQGIGGQLIRRVLSEATQQGASVELTVLKASPARRLYERFGFRVVEERPHSTVMRFDSSV